MKIGRNEPCPCGSGRNYRWCCLGRDEERRAAATRSSAGTDRAGLREEALDQRAVGGDLGAQRLDRDRTAQRLVHAAVDHAHRAGRQARLDEVCAQPPAGERVRAHAAALPRVTGRVKRRIARRYPRTVHDFAVKFGPARSTGIALATADAMRATASARPASPRPDP
jgi:hypothetical protein